MSQPFIAEIRIFASNFAPRNFAFCDGTLLPVAQNTALFALIGNIYGGDGRTTLGLPNLQDRLPMHPGRGPGLTPRVLGQSGGTATVALTSGNMPNHSHSMLGTGDAPNSASPANAVVATAPAYEATGSNLTNMANEALLPAGGGQAHDNQQPYLTLNFIIALQGLFPSRA
jgi:microcystin-dependent protein